MKRLFQGWSWEHWYNLAREDIEDAFASVKRVATIAVYCGLGLWVFSGFHIVRQNEVGLTTHFGKLSRGYEDPGLRYRLPWPVGSVYKVPVQTQQRVAVGIVGGEITANERLNIFQKRALDTNVGREFDNTDTTERSELEEVIDAGQKKATGEGKRTLLGSGLSLLTADHNVIQVQAYVQYIIKDPKQFIYGGEDAPLMITRAATDSLLEASARTKVDDLLTTARAEVQNEVAKSVQAEVGKQCGIEVAGVQLQRLVPPDAVAQAFRNVNSAREERNTVVNEAQQYLGQTVPQAQGQADQIISEAEGNREKRVAEAKGESSRFWGVLREFRANPDVTGERLRIEAIERALAQAEKVQLGGTLQSPVDMNLWTPAPGQ